MAKLIKKIPLLIATTGLLAAALLTYFALKPAHQAIQPPIVKVSNLNSSKPHRILWRRVQVYPGDTLQSIFAQQRIPQQELWKLLRVKDQPFAKLMPRQVLEFTLDAEHHLLELRTPWVDNKILQIKKDQHGQLRKKIITPKIHTVVAFKSGKITSTLEKATQAVQLPPSIYHQLLRIFQGRINFSHDLHVGDRFFIVYTEQVIPGRKPQANNIVIAELQAKHQTYHAIHFSYGKKHSGYYLPSRAGVEPRFLSYPVHFKRVSSHFAYHRLDPIVHRVRPHLGIDFAAHAGTPIRSVGSGRIVYIGHNRGYGNAIKIRYDRHYSALYAHMQRFAKNLKLHQYIKKGQVIGYVGSTGWSTGPHLHFGFYVNGIAKNWLALKPPAISSVPRRYKNSFNQTVKQSMAALETYKTAAITRNLTAMDTP